VTGAARPQIFKQVNMRKFSALDALDQPRRRRSRAPLVYLLIVVLLATPPLYELGKLHLARSGLFNLSTAVETPLLDYLSKGWESGQSDVRDFVAPWMARPRWNPQLVIPVAFFWTAVAALMLRRGH
jgi:hypothetical protein